jgi:hypothetical protein
MKNRHSPQLKTSLEDLLAAASEVAFEYSNNDKEAHDLAQLALIEIIRKASQSLDIEGDFDQMPSPSEVIH